MIDDDVMVLTLMRGIWKGSEEEDEGVKATLPGGDWHRKRAAVETESSRRFLLVESRVMMNDTNHNRSGDFLEGKRSTS